MSRLLSKCCPGILKPRNLIESVWHYPSSHSYHIHKLIKTLSYIIYIFTITSFMYSHLHFTIRYTKSIKTSQKANRHNTLSGFCISTQQKLYPEPVKRGKYFLSIQHNEKYKVCNWMYVDIQWFILYSQLHWVPLIFRILKLLARRRLEKLQRDLLLYCIALYCELTSSSVLLIAI